MGWSGCKYPFICSWQDKWQRDRFHLVFVCWLDFLLVSLAHLAWLGWQEHMFLDPDTWFFSRTKLWWPLCVSEPVQTSMFSLFIVTWLWPFMHLGYLGWLWWHKYSFLDAETWFIQGPYFDELCACLSQHIHSLLENYEPLLLPLLSLPSLLFALSSLSQPYRFG